MRSSKSFLVLFFKKGLLPSQAPVSLIFLCHGILLGTWATQVPLVRDHLALSPATLGAGLFFASAGALLVMPVTGRLVARAGVGMVIRVGAAVASAALLFAVTAGGFAALCGALFMFGLGFGAVDVAMNAEAVRVERVAGGRC